LNNFLFNLFFFKMSGFLHNLENNAEHLVDRISNIDRVSQYVQY